MTPLKTGYQKTISSIKKGFADIKTVSEEGNIKLFLKQAIVVGVLILGFRYANSALEQKDQNIIGQINAVQAQKDNEQEFLSNKTKLLDLEPRFPDLSTKNDWLLRQILSIFRDSTLTPKVGSSQNEDSSNNGFTVVSIPVEINTSYTEFGRLLADIENRDEYLRVSEFDLEKSKENLGMNNIKMKFNTVFPKEKIAASVFKNLPKEEQK